MVKMTEETEKLIELVRGHVHLYDPRHSDYKNVVKKAESWKEIARILNQTSKFIICLLHFSMFTSDTSTNMLHNNITYTFCIK